MTIFFLLFLASTSVFALTVNPVRNVIQCQVSLFSWRDGVAPYNVSICSTDDPSAPPLVNLTEMGPSCQWKVNLPVGFHAVLEVRDSDGNTAQSDGFTVQLGSDNNCLKSTDTDTQTSASAGATSGAIYPGSAGSVLTSSASVTAGGIMNGSENASSTNTGTAPSPSLTAAAASPYIPVGTLAMTGVAALAVALQVVL